MRDYKQLLVWDRSHKLALDIYKLTGNFTREELYGKTSQLIRAAVSIPTYIVEGCGRRTDKDFSDF